MPKPMTTPLVPPVCLNRFLRIAIQWVWSSIPLELRSSHSILVQGNNEYTLGYGQYSGEMSLERPVGQDTPDESDPRSIECSCLNCRQIGRGHRGVLVAGYTCRVDGCDQTFPDPWYHVSHERQHYLVKGISIYANCPEPNCVFKADIYNGWDGFMRHTRSKHCKKIPEFSCPLAWCNRRGDKGFTRKDKLTNHLRSVHKRDIPKDPRRIRAAKPSTSSANKSDHA